MDLDEFRATIPAAKEATYLKTGSSSPSSVDVVEAMQAFLEHHGYESPTTEGMYKPVYKRSRPSASGLDPEAVHIEPDYAQCCCVIIRQR
jgi:hypothetical protein